MTGGFGPSLGPLSPSDSSQRWTGHARVLGPSWTHLPVLTIGLLGVQIFWSVEMSYASPYLVSLGLTTSQVALVFLAGPLSGLLVQPLVGAYADTNTSRWGRRRPYILTGCVICVAGMLLLGYTRAVAGVVFARGGRAHDVLTIILAVLAIFVIDFSINAVQAVDRALLVDTLPPAQQAAGNACAALMLGFGSVVGFFIGYLPLRTLLPFLQAESELQALSVLVSVVLLVCHGLTAMLTRERVLLKTAGTRRPSLKQEIREIWTHMRVLPRVIRQICFIQFFAWLGWFPVAFYTTLYITDVYLQEGSAFALKSGQAAAETLLSSNGTAVNNGTTDYPPLVRVLARALAGARTAPTASLPRAFLRASSPLNATISLPSPSDNSTSLSSNVVGPADVDAPTRLGARAQLLSALLALATNALLPLLIPDPAVASASSSARRRGLRNSRLMGRVDLGNGVGVGGGVSPIDGVNGLAGGLNGDGGGLGLGLGGGKAGEGKARWWHVRVPDVVRVPLPTLWAASHAIFAGCMFWSFFAHSVWSATFLIACTGFSWGVTQWAPFSLLAEAILTAPDPTVHAGGNHSTSIRLADTRTRAQAEEEEGFLVSRPGEESDSDGEDTGDEIEFVKPARRDGENGHHDEDPDGYGDDEDDSDGPSAAYPPPPRHHNNKSAALLLGNAAAQLSVVDVLTPRSTWGDDRRFEPEVGAAPPPGDGEGELMSSRDVERGERGEGEGGGLSAKAGVILGIHNIFIVIPQFLVTGLAAVIFAIFDGKAAVPGHAPLPGETEAGRNSVVYVFRIGGIWASIAFVLAWRLARELRRG
ncbi:major facilitator superfamily domain-containing protein [Mycena capillaripes]|nr:major facilitator superfamily domain-containing protein [Mycena capillaripes]